MMSLAIQYVIYFILECVRVRVQKNMKEVYMLDY